MRDQVTPDRQAIQNLRIFAFMKHLNITISGRVQGVGFRRSARDQARYLGIKGFVKNQHDGTVYIEAEADDAAMAQFVIWCRQGPPFAVVEEIHTEPGDLKHFPSFDTKF